MKKILMKVLMKVKFGSGSEAGESSPGFDLEIAFHDEGDEVGVGAEQASSSDRVIEVVPLKPFASSGQ